LCSAGGKWSSAEFSINSALKVQFSVGHGVIVRIRKGVCRGGGADLGGSTDVAN
jgi:hypothetical protein